MHEPRNASKIRKAIIAINHIRVKISTNGTMYAKYPALEARVTEFIEFVRD